METKKEVFEENEMCEIYEDDPTPEDIARMLDDFRFGIEWGRKSMEERVKILDTGVFNVFIKGYLVATLEGIGRDDLVPEAVDMLRWVLDTRDPMKLI